MKGTDINRIFGIDESFKLPNRLMEILFDEQKKNEVMDSFMEIGETLDHDWFTEYFEEEHSNKSRMHQDFTPRSITDIITRMSGKGLRIADICSGTGGLTISVWNNNKDGWFHCEEISERAIPLLLFNMAIRNMTGEVVNCDVLNGDIFKVYKLDRGGKYSTITVINVEDYKLARDFDIVVENPPYSLAWKYDEKKQDERMLFGYPPTSKADYAFIQYGLWLLKEPGKLLTIVPHGVLFRGQKEHGIRKSIVENNMLRTVIGLPDKLFANTDIPTCICEFKRNSGDVLFIDSSKNFKKDKRLNIMETEHVAKVIECWQQRCDIEKFSHLTYKSEIIENDFNLNIPRYVNTFEPEPEEDLREIMRDIAKTNREIERTEKELYNMMKKMVGTSPESDKELKQALRIWGNSIIKREYVQEEFDFG